MNTLKVVCAGLLGVAMAVAVVVTADLVGAW